MLPEQSQHPDDDEVGPWQRFAGDWASDAGAQEYFESTSGQVYRTTCGLQRLLYHKPLPQADREMVAHYVTEYRVQCLP